MITLAILSMLAFALFFGVLADIIVWFTGVAMAVAAVPLGILALIALLVLFSGKLLVFAVPFVLGAICMGVYHANKRPSVA